MASSKTRPRLDPAREDVRQQVLAEVHRHLGPSLTFEALDLAADAALRISAYTAEPGSASENALNLLAS